MKTKPMERYYVFKDGNQIGSAATRENAIDMIRTYQKMENWYYKAEFSIIKGVEKFIKYE